MKTDTDQTDQTPKRIPRWREPFLKALAQSGNVLFSCRAAEVNRANVYAQRALYPVFRRKWDAAIDEAVDTLEAEARRRALDGVEKPVYYKGKKIDVIREYSDTLLIFLLKAHRPEKYRDNYDVRRIFEEVCAAQQAVSPGQSLTRRAES